MAIITIRKLIMEWIWQRNENFLWIWFKCALHVLRALSVWLTAIILLDFGSLDSNTIPNSYNWIFYCGHKHIWCFPFLYISFLLQNHESITSLQMQSSRCWNIFMIWVCRYDMLTFALHVASFSIVRSNKSYHQYYLQCAMMQGWRWRVLQKGKILNVIIVNVIKSHLWVNSFNNEK